MYSVPLEPILLQIKIKDDRARSILQTILKNGGINRDLIKRLEPASTV